MHAIVDAFDKCATSNMKTLAKHANDVPGRLNKEANAFQNKCYQETLQKLEQLFAQRRTVSEIEKTNATFNYLAYMAVMKAETGQAAQ